MELDRDDLDFWLLAAEQLEDRAQKD